MIEVSETEMQQRRQDWAVLEHKAQMLRNTKCVRNHLRAISSMIGEFYGEKWLDGEDWLPDAIDALLKDATTFLDKVIPELDRQHSDAMRVTEMADDDERGEDANADDDNVIMPDAVREDQRERSLPGKLRGVVFDLEQTRELVHAASEMLEAFPKPSRELLTSAYDAMTELMAILQKMEPMAKELVAGAAIDLVRMTAPASH